MIRPRLTSFWALLPFLVSAPVPVSAQGWTLDASAGRSVYEGVGANVGAQNGMLGVRFAGQGGGWFYLAGAAPLSADDPFWGVSGFGRRFSSRVGQLSGGVDLGAHGHGFRDPASEVIGTGGTLQALPWVAVQGRSLRLELATGGTHYASSFDRRTLSRSVHDSGARLTMRRVQSLSLVGQARYVRAEEDAYPYLGGSALLALGRADIWGSAGRWLSDALPGTSVGAGATFHLSPKLDLWASLRQDASDPIYWNDSRHSWNVGVSRRLGVARPVATPMSPAAVSAGRVTFRLPLVESRNAPSIAGDFTGWEPVVMVRSSDFWMVELPVRSGLYHYAFRTADGQWFVPEYVPGRREDGFGGFVAVLVVQ
jgi:hypothetical protein